MNSHWKDNLIIFTMELIPTYSDGRIKIRVFGALEFDVETYKMSFWDDFDQF